MNRELRESRLQALSRPPVLKTQASIGVGVNDVIQQIDNHLCHLQQHPSQKAHRVRAHARARLLDLVNEELGRRMTNQADQHSTFNLLVEAVVERRSDPHDAAAAVLQRIP